MAEEEIVENIRKNLGLLKQRETEVSKNEERIKAELEAIKQQTASCEEDRKNLESQLAAFEREKEAMAKIPTSDDDVIRLNVQGEIICTLRSTLTQFPETKMTYMFNGRWQDKIPTDGNGNIFLDISPALFRKLLDFLSARRLAGGSSIPFPTIEADQTEHFKLILKFFDIESSIHTNWMSFSHHLRSSFIELSPDSLSATNTSHDLGYVLGATVFRNETVKIVLQIEKLENPWMFFGVMKDGALNKENIKDCSFNGNSNAYGWADKGGYWKAGVRQKQGNCSIPQNVLRQGQMVELLLNSQSAPSSLTIKLPTLGHTQEISDLPASCSWRLHINLVSFNDSVRVVKVERT